MHKILLSNWLLYHIIIVEILDSSVRGINSVAIIIINPRKEYWPSRGSNQLKSDALPTELLDWLSSDLCNKRSMTNQCSIKDLWLVHGASIFPPTTMFFTLSKVGSIKTGGPEIKLVVCKSLTLSQTSPDFYMSAVRVF